MRFKESRTCLLLCVCILFSLSSCQDLQLDGVLGVDEKSEVTVPTVDEETGASETAISNATEDEESENSTKPACKRMVFTPNTYDFVQGDLPGETWAHVAAINETFKNFSVNIENDNIEVCYPLSQKFRTCVSWGMYQEEYELLPDLRLFVYPYKKIYDIGDYKIRDTMAFVCAPDDTSGNDRNDFNYMRLYPIHWIISCLFLLTTAVIYFMKPRLGTSGKIQLCHITSLFMTYLFLTIHRFFSVNPTTQLSGCLFLASSIQWWFLSSFAWLNVLSFHIYYYVAVASGSKSSVGNRTFFSRFSLYSIYAWLVPTVIAATTLILELCTDEQESSFRPRFAAVCWFNNDRSIWAFFYGPMSAILVANLLFFILTVVHLQQRARSSMVEKNVDQILLYMKLLVVMGLCWILEVISWMLRDSITPVTYVLDTITSLQGVFIFLAYNCHVSIYSFIKNGNCSGEARDIIPTSQDSHITDDDNYTNNIKHVYNVNPQLQEKKANSAA